MTLARHCEERSDAAIQNRWRGTGLPRLARNDGTLRAFAPSREPQLLFNSRKGAKAQRDLVLRLMRHNMPPVGE